MGSVDEARALVEEMLWPNERIRFCVRQSKLWILGGSLSSPSIIVATNKRLILVTKPLFGLYQDYEILHYKQIVGIRVTHGIFTSSIYIATNGTQTHSAMHHNASNSTISGIYKGVGGMIASYLNDMMVKWHEFETYGNIADVPRTKQDMGLLVRN
ncbi:MAG: PH domain-containing protein [Candidatus Micrarchaeales archaeon]